ncbi:unnamed protein product, partial [Discosporangium mesarthrocarpum]
MVMALAAHEDWELFHWDVRQAFIQAKVKEDICIRLCEGCARWTGKAAKLVKSLYGCRQSSRNFCLLLVQALEEIGSEQCKADPCVLRLVSAGKVCALIAPHVDDLMVAGIRDSVEEVHRKIEAQFFISDLGDLQLYMGCTVSQDQAARTITVDQTVYVKSVCKRYNKYHAVGEVPHVPYRRLAGQQ